MMSHYTQQDLTALASGELIGWQAWRLRAHLRRCEACQRDYVATASLWKQAQELSAEEAPAGLRGRLDAALVGVGVATPTVRARGIGPAKLTLVAAGAVAAAAVVVVVSQRALVTQQPEGTIRKSPLRGLGSGAETQRRLVHDPLHSPNTTADRPRHLVNQPAIIPAVQIIPRGGGGARKLLPVDDIAYLNAGVHRQMGLWASLPPDEVENSLRDMSASVRGGDDFVSVPLPRLASREASAIRASLAAYRAEKEIVDTRLVRKVNVAVKGMAFSDLCKELAEKTGIELRAGKSVADDKATLFCRDQPLRDLMRQVTLVFGFSWRRSGEEGKYEYELFQDLRSQLLEEELRNKDRNEALLALDGEMQRYQKYLNLTPEEARERLKSASPDEKLMLDNLGGVGWGPAHLYSGLSGEEMTTLRNGGTVRYGSIGRGNGSPLPPGTAGGMLDSMPGITFDVGPDGQVRAIGNIKGGQRPQDVPGVKVGGSLQLVEQELGQMSLFGATEIGAGPASMSMGASLAVGMSPSVRDPKNGVANAKAAGDPALQPAVTVEPKTVIDASSTAARADRCTTADVLEALHRQSGVNIVADYYTRLYPATEVTVKGTKLFAALNRLADRMRFKWTKDRGWLQFRSTGFFNERPKEVANRLLERWSASVKEHGTLTGEDLVEIAQLTDAQLDSASMAEGARVLYGLKQWNLAATGNFRRHWRFVGTFGTPQRKALWEGKAISFESMALSQQQWYFSATMGQRSDLGQARLEDMRGSTLEVEYLPATGAGAETTTAAPEAARDHLMFTYRYGRSEKGPYVMQVGHFFARHGPLNNKE
jgi:hypothetical protein